MLSVIVVFGLGLALMTVQAQQRPINPGNQHSVRVRTLGAVGLSGHPETAGVGPASAADRTPPGPRANAGVTLAGSPPLREAVLKPEDLYAVVSPSVVTLEVENAGGRQFVGSAFLALGDGLAVTAWHVVHDARRVEARFADGQRVKVAGLVDKDETLDLALVKLESGGRARLTLGAATPRIGSRVYLVGAPRGFDFSLSEGLVSQVRTLDGVRYYQLSCPISPGDSGGPVLNDHGEAIGVLSWRKADAENLGFAIPGPAVTRMNAGLPVVAWADARAGTPPPEPRPASAPQLRASLAPGGTDATNSFSDLLGFLSRRGGQRVTVTVREAGGEDSRFAFEVPQPAAK